MIPRYTLPEFANIWSEQNKYETWFKVEHTACLVMEQAGQVPENTYSKINNIFQEKKSQFDPNRILEIEKTCKHDVIAFLTHVEELVGEDARYLHLGMTSSDVVDTSFSILLTEATQEILIHFDKFIDSLSNKVCENAMTPVIGRTHGIHAEPTTFGTILAGYLAEAKRNRKRLIAANNNIAVGKISGAVGSFAHLDPLTERKILGRLGLRPETVSTQIIPRDRHAEYFTTLGVIASSIERLALNIRHWQRTEVSEAEEKFTVGQKGSSAMPHKRNPIVSENLCGLARMVRSSVIPALENVALWHERDISHSSVERMIGPDATSLLGYMLFKADDLVKNLVIYKDNMQKNLGLTNSLYFSEAVMLTLVKSGLPRQKSYEMVQRNAMKTINDGSDFQNNLLNDSDILTHISCDDIKKCFDMDHALRHVTQIIEAAMMA